MSEAPAPIYQIDAFIGNLFPAGSPFPLAIQRRAAGFGCPPKPAPGRIKHAQELAGGDGL